jgi:hypothetical protein
LNYTRGPRESTDAKGLFTTTFSNVNIGGYESLNLTKDGFMSFKKVEDLSSVQRRAVKTIEKKHKEWVWF